VTSGSQDPLEGEPVSDEVSADLDALRRALVHPPSSEIATRHLSRITGDAGRALRGQGLASHYDELAARREHRRRRWAVAAVASVGVVLGTGGLAAAGVLPTPVQDVIADVARPFGLDLPHSDDEPGSGGGGSSTSTTSGSSQDAPGQSGDAPGQGGTSPGQSEGAPGQGGTSPGQSDEAPGLGGSPAGQSDEAPGLGGSSPGGSGNSNAGGNENSNAGGNGNGGVSTEAPGQGGANPSNTAPGQSG
jgi:hypothetical protein